MKDLVFGYSRPTDEEFAEMWRQCVFAFDANTLLNIYRYTPETQEKFFAALERLKERIWIPRQAASEYQKNREEVINSQLKVYDEVAARFEEIEKTAKHLEENFKKHRSIKIKSVVEQIRNGLANAKASLDKDKAQHPKTSDHEKLHDQVVEILAGKTGAGFDDKRLAQIYEEAEQRFKVQRPPGFGDIKKPVPDRYGDVVMWFQIIEYAKTEKKPLIFVTDDRKDDWWLKKSGKTVSPRPELLEEFDAAAKVRFYMYQSEQFIERALEFFDIEDRQSAVEEIQEIRKQDEAQEAKQNTAFDRIDSSQYSGKSSYRTIPSLDFNAIREATALRAALGPTLPLVGEHAHNLTRQIFSDFAHSAIPDAAHEAARTAHEAAKALVSQPQFGETLRDIAARAASPFAQSMQDTLARTALRLDQPTLGAISQINQPALDAARQWQETLDRSGLRGRRIPRSLDIAISKFDSSELNGAENQNKVKVEIILRDAPLEETDDEADEEFDADAQEADATNEIELFDFDRFPFAVALVHGRNTGNSHETTHCLRRAAPKEWQAWAQAIERTRRYWSPAELAEHNADRSEEERADEVFNDFYWEHDANDFLYDRIIGEIAGVRLDKDDDFPLDRFRRLPPEIIAKFRYGIKDAAIKSFYECYCWLEKPKNPGANENLVCQRLSHWGKDFAVNHILRKATAAESSQFRTQIIEGYKLVDEDDREIIVLKLNLQVADRFYDELILNVENALVDGQPFAQESRACFLGAINPVYKLRVLEAHLNIHAWYFTIDDIVFP